MQCSSAAMLGAYLDGELRPDQLVVVQEHLRSCTHCSSEIAEMRKAAAKRPWRARALHAQCGVSAEDAEADFETAPPQLAVLVRAHRSRVRDCSAGCHCLDRARAPGCRLFRAGGPARQCVIQHQPCRRCFNRQAYGEAVVPGQDSLLFQPAGIQRHRLHTGRRAYGLFPSTAWELSSSCRCISTRYRS